MNALQPCSRNCSRATQDRGEEVLVRIAVMKRDEAGQRCGQDAEQCPGWVSPDPQPPRLLELGVSCHRDVPGGKGLMLAALWKGFAVPWPSYTSAAPANKSRAANQPALPCGRATPGAGAGLGAEQAQRMVKPQQRSHPQHTQLLAGPEAFPAPQPQSCSLLSFTKALVQQGS